MGIFYFLFLSDYPGSPRLALLSAEPGNWGLKSEVIKMLLLKKDNTDGLLLIRLKISSNSANCGWPSLTKTMHVGKKHSQIELARIVLEEALTQSMHAQYPVSIFLQCKRGWGKLTADAQ